MEVTTTMDIIVGKTTKQLESFFCITWSAGIFTAVSYLTLFRRQYNQRVFLKANVTIWDTFSPSSFNKLSWLSNCFVREMTATSLKLNYFHALGGQLRTDITKRPSQLTSDVLFLVHTKIPRRLKVMKRWESEIRLFWEVDRLSERQIDGIGQKPRVSWLGEDDDVVCWRVKDTESETTWGRRRRRYVVGQRSRRRCRGAVGG